MISKYLWLVRRLLYSGERGMTIKQIAKAWENHWGIPFNRRTFNMQRHSIEDLFGLSIVCNLSNYTYTIKSLELDSIQSYLLHTYTMADVVGMGSEQLQGRIKFEEVPSGSKYLTMVIEAMRENTVLRISYHKYTSDLPESLHVHPYAARQYSQRWYLVGWCEEREALRVYSLDRIEDIVEEGRNFKFPDDFDVDVSFKNSYGMYLPDRERPEEILIRATPTESKYLRDLPLHSSQKEVGEGLFSFKVIPNAELVMELAGRGDRLEVLSPEDLRQKVAQEHRKALELYEKK